MEGIGVFDGFSEDSTQAYRSAGGFHTTACNVLLPDYMRNRSLGRMLTG